ncbi:hypothetical protein NG895_15390 [Aeoliella sp. ICT_H6.2]|uniref:Uncharacterized protein n=1 Tax=Aeoliella straminimaris TaxID=2954799 RepID=A0A9X2FB53_9BACT|nr:hypothetical protein [Aeoliella straminimaris]MCO6045294.1 hypothetical protein [Aeoliella straminimaris]
MQRWSVGITTTPRRQSTLEDCLDSLARAGWENPRLFLDGSARVPARYEHLCATWREGRVGAWPAFYLAMVEMILHDPNADAYMLLQDDVMAHDRESLREYLEQVLWPGYRPGLVSLFYTGHDTTAGWHRADGNWDWGAQAFIFPAGVARAFVTDVEMSRSMLAASGENHIPIPELIFEWVMRRGIETWYAIPSLTQHIGNTSTIWGNAAISGGRRANWFSGSTESEFAVEEDLSSFPEELFPCKKEHSSRYVEIIERGRKRMRDLRVAICGVCHNARPALPRIAARLERLAAMFRDFRIVFCDHQSSDVTREFLYDWQQVNDRVDVLTLEMPGRPPSYVDHAKANLVQCRNVCRDYVLEHYAHVDYVMVLDTQVLGGWSFDGIAHTFGTHDWDVVGSYGLRYRSMRQEGKGPFEHFDEQSFQPQDDIGTDLIDFDGELVVERGQPLISVKSCFGGLAIYRLACMQAAEYVGAECEHVALHDELRRLGFDRIFLNPSQIALYAPSC